LNLAVKELSVASIISCSPDGSCYLHFFLVTILAIKEKNYEEREKRREKKRKIDFAREITQKRYDFLVKNIIGAKI